MDSLAAIYCMARSKLYSAHHKFPISHSRDRARIQLPGEKENPENAHKKTGPEGPVL